MHDRKVVRRRRAVLGLLVACALILLTAYFGEGAGGGLHSIQRGALAVFSPVESVASDAVKPFRDLIGWFGDTFDAKGKNKDLRKEVDALRVEVAQLNGKLRTSQQLDKITALDGQNGIGSMKPVNARVVIASANLWYSTVNINRGSSDGVHVNDPVINGDGLVGLVTKTVGDAAQVRLITDSESGVSARIAETGVPGFVQTGTPGDPNDLLMQRLPRNSSPRAGQMIITAGVRSSRFASLFPAGIPIGVVTKVDPNELDTSQQIHIKPYANMHNLDVVQVLTQPDDPVERPVTAVNVPLLIRLAVLAFVMVLLQLMFFAQVPVFGAIADLSPLVVLAVGLLCGPVTGAAMGFTIGLMVDTALLQTMGLSSLVLIVVGYWSGRLREARDPQSPLAPIPLGAGAAAITTIGYGIGQFLLGATHPLSWILLKQTLATIILDALIAVPVVSLVRRWLLPVLPEDPRRRRRRAYTTGGLSPLQKA